MGVDHYENFPVASWLCPPALRPAVTAIYRFARTADDIADEGDAPPAERVAKLDDFEAALHGAAEGHVGGDWPEVFRPLAQQIRAHALPLVPFTDLLSAFRQDAGNPAYPDRAALLDYCARSANPIGRLLLHLVHIDDRESQAQSDAICSALQLINFWQDLSIDLPRGRSYLPLADIARAGLDPTALRRGADNDATRKLVSDLCKWSRELMRQGSPLVHRMPGRFGWELRFVVQGGERVLDKIENAGFNALSIRPTLTAADGPRLIWRALRMAAHAPARSAGDSPRKAMR